METTELFSLQLNYWILQTIAMMLTCLIIPGLRVTGLFGAVAAVVVLAFVNSKVWDAALFFQIPNSFSSRALLLLLSNGFIFWIVVKLLPGIEIHGILPAILAPIVFTVCSLAVAYYGGNIDWVELGKQGVEYIRDLKSFFDDTGPLPVVPSPSPTPSP